jgi:hypothetical protein
VIALALLLPLLITLPGPGSDTPPKPVNVEVDLGSSAPPEPLVPDVSSMASHEETSALARASEVGVEAADTLADVGPETEPAPEGQQAVAPIRAAPAAKSVTAQKPKPKVQVKTAKSAGKVSRASPQKKPLLGLGRPSKPLFGGGTTRSKAQGPSWSALLNAAPSAADARR